MEAVTLRPSRFHRVPPASKTWVPPPNSRHVLLVEDNLADVELFKLAAKECEEFSGGVSVLSDSKDAIVYLRRGAPYQSAVKPDLIVVDYKLPIDGGIALTEIKGDPDFMHIPITVLTGSNNPRDFRDAYARHANCCFRKPVSLDEYTRLICYIADLWFHRCVLP